MVDWVIRDFTHEQKRLRAQPPLHKSRRYAPSGSQGKERMADATQVGRCFPAHLSSAVACALRKQLAGYRCVLQPTDGADL